jgi:hypothetical protein
MTPEDRAGFEAEHQNMIAAGLVAQGRRTPRRKRKGDLRAAGGRIGSVASIRPLSVSSLPQPNEPSKISHEDIEFYFKKEASNYAESLPDEDITEQLSGAKTSDDASDSSGKDDNSIEEIPPEKVFSKEEAMFFKSRRTQRMIQRSTKKLMAKLQDDSDE